MKYVVWLWNNSRGIRWNTLVRIVTGTGQVVLGLTMVWLSKRFIDETIHTGSPDDVLRMVTWLVLTVVGGVVLRQVGYWLTTTASIRQTNALRLLIFSSLFRRQLFTGQELHSGDVTSRLAKDIEQVSTVCTDTLPQMTITMIQLCGAFLLMRWFDARLAWALLLLTPLAIIFGKLIARRLRQMTLNIRQDESRIQMQVQEGMEYNAVLRSLGSEQWVTDRLDTMQQRLRGNVMRRTRFTVVMRFIMGSHGFRMGRHRTAQRHHHVWRDDLIPATGRHDTAPHPTTAKHGTRCHPCHSEHRPAGRTKGCGSSGRRPCKDTKVQGHRGTRQHPRSRRQFPICRRRLQCH